MPDKYGVGPDEDCYANSEVLLNLLGITDGVLLAEAEVAFTRLRLSQYDYPPLSEFSLDTLKNIHFYLFQDVYAWAGELRVVDVSKGATRFAHCNRVEPEAKKLFARLKNEKYLTALSRSDFLAKAAYYFSELNVIHPFRDGNGRAQRLMFESIAINAGFSFRWGAIDSSLWIAANVAAYQLDLSLLIRLFDAALSELI